MVDVERKGETEGKAQKTREMLKRDGLAISLRDDFGHEA